ncbi:MAG: AAA family ATPase [Thermodesulfobacteriota bacterium]
MKRPKKLPIGIQTFREIREDDCYYVDKTAFALRLAEEGKYYFLSRPRRFGKSLFLDTLAEMFAGNEPLFRGLFLHDRWDWQQVHPVIRVSFGGGVLQSLGDLADKLEEILRDNAQRLGLSCDYPLADRRSFAQLIRRAHERFGRRAVVLVDEYDKPIVDNITQPEVARAMRDGLRNLYSVIKDVDAHIKFAFLTGVSKFSKVSLFSGLNNLRDITLSPDYATVCGYTATDLDTVFSPELPGLDRREILRWYNGYRWLGEGVCNPFDVLLVLKERQIRPYWFETGTPTFLIDLLARRQVFAPDLARLATSADLLGRFDVDDMATEALLFQTGYLTIIAADEPVTGRWVYTLGFPNQEVASSLNEALIPSLGLDASKALGNRLSILAALRDQDFAAVRRHLNGLLDSIPHDWYRRNDLDRFEGYYASVIYSHLAALGLDVRVEDKSSRGQVDMVLFLDRQIVILELKVVENTGPGKALAQIKERGYAARYRGHGHLIHLIGVELSRQSRNIVAFDVERDTVPAASPGGTGGKTSA